MREFILTQRRKDAENAEKISGCLRHGAWGSAPASITSAHSAPLRLCVKTLSAAFIILLSVTANALPLVWRADWPGSKPVETLVHRGTDIEFQPQWYINGELANSTNWTFQTFVQTNNQATGEWFGPLPGAAFSHTNDIGAAFYNVMVRAAMPGGGVNYTAFARLRMLDSPGYTPGELPLPVSTIDFSKVVALNAPWLLPSATNGFIKAETDPTVPAWAKGETPPLPPGYATVSSAATNAASRAELAAAAQTATNYTDSAAASLSSRLSFASAAATNYTDSASAALSAAKQDKLPYQTNAIPQSVISGLSTALAGKLDKTGGTVMGLTVEDASMPIFSIKSANAEAAFWMNGTNVMVTVFNFNTGSVSTYHFDRVVDDEVAVLGDLQGLGVDLSPATNYTDSATNALNESLSSRLSLASLAAANYTDAAVGEISAASLGAVPTSRTVNGKALSSNISISASDVGAATAEDVYRLIAGTNVVLVVTNYNSATHAPAMKLQHLDPESGQYVTYWDEQRRHGMTLTHAMNYTDAQIETRAPRAWSGTTSGLGAEAPAGVTWISTPETVIAGGYEYEKVVTTAGAVWVLTSNGLSTGATTNSFFRVSASDGTELFSIEKTDSYLVGINADGITRSGNTVTIPINVVGANHPYIRATTNIVDAVWTKEDENGFSCPWAAVSWSGSTGAYVATVTCSQPAAFFYFEYMVEGVAKVKNTAKTELTGGIIFNGQTYMPTVSGTKLEFVRQ